MDKERIKRKIILWVRVAGWSCLFPASGSLYIYQKTSSLIFLLALVVDIIYAISLLIGASKERWLKPQKYLSPIIWGVLFVGLLPAAILLVPQNYAKKLNIG